MDSKFEPDRSVTQACETLGEFVRVHRIACANPREEWMAILADKAEVVVLDIDGAPSPLGIEKAIAIVQSRAYLEKRAIRLLTPFFMTEGAWRLLTIDFGVEAQRHQSEFLMCFAFEAANTVSSSSSPFVKIGFTLQKPLAVDPMFLLTVKTFSGFPSPAG